ncbi:hypothetical protein GDO81_006198 [Engystomops pustulosus]|uniref:Ig-like domain-containing protein n=1 Tax=Engystomops pustulosus TaxID=76066 RepID=A0AAV7CYA7_ENGPU|nr:hypothetical protein GDO81_006198 [Engystomops pustulosus]
MEQTLQQHVVAYLDSTLPPQVDDHLEYWAPKLDVWPQLAEFAIEKLFCPAIRVASEQNFTISSIQFSDRANYQCQTNSSAISDIVRLCVTTDLTILRVALRVFEGDILNLTCDSRPDMNTTGAKASFSKNSRGTHTFRAIELLKPMNEETYFFLGKVDTTVHGDYMCTKQVLLENKVNESEAGETIQLTALFSDPEIKFSSDVLYTGMDQTVTCETTLHPLRADTELQFAFYRNGWPVQGFGSSNKYIVPYTTVEDSGKYTCVVSTIWNSVRKITLSKVVEVHEYYRPVLTTDWDKIYKSDTVHMRCGDSDSAVTFAWYKDNVHFHSGSDTLSIKANSYADVGYYQCSGSYGERSNRVHLDVAYGKFSR